jgi:putative transposase
MTSYSFQNLKTSFLQNPTSQFAHALPETDIEKVCQEQGVSFGQDPDAVFTPAITLWAFLSQVLFKGELRYCLAAVTRIGVLLVALQRPPCAHNTGAYCRARAKIPIVIFRRLCYQLADRCEQSIPENWLWKGRHVRLVDGTTASMPDTPDNQEAFPQSKSQKPGLGFPIIRMVLLLSLATAMVTGLAIGPYGGKESGETALFRQLLDRLTTGDVVVADRFYCSYFMVALLRERGIDAVLRLHQCRKQDLEGGQRLGSGDRLVIWNRPAKPDWMDQETYDRMPETLEVRQVHVQVNQPGFRVESLVVISTLIDADVYSREDLAELYHKRWLVELDIRSIKVSLGMDVLRGKSSEMVRREIWACLLAYNLIRQSMLEAASLAKLSPRQLSFTAAMDKIAVSWVTLQSFSEGKRHQMIAHLLVEMGKHKVGNRPNRAEPRAKKRRPKGHKLLTEPRSEARAKLLRRAEESSSVGGSEG